jgi:hypothetical protein
VQPIDKERDMARGTRFVTDEHLTVVGRRYNCDDVGTEASEILGRWRRDLGALGSYGFGPTALAAFEADVTAHASLRSSRPDAVAEKRTAAVVRDKQVSRGWAWVDKVEAVLGGLARADQQVATALAAAMPVDDAALEPGIRALSALLGEHKDKLPPEVQLDKRLAEVDELCAALRVQPGNMQVSRSRTIADTAQIDLFDGKLYLRMRDLNAAARSAIRNGDLQASLGEYTFHRLKRSGNPSPTVQAVPASAPAPAAKQLTAG